MSVDPGTGTLPHRAVREPATARAVWRRIRDRGRPLSLVENSLALIASKLATLGLGFLFWLLAARLFARGEVGVAAAVVSAMMLCTQLALLGVGSSVITHYREHEQDPERLIHSALLIVVGASTVVATAFVVIAGAALDKLDVVASSPAYALLFVVTTVSGTVAPLLDQTSTALRRGDQALTRGILSGLLPIVLLAPLGFTGTGGSEAIFLPWGIAGIATWGLGALQLRRTLGRFGLRPRTERRLLGSLVRVGLPNHALTLAERMPGLIIPILVTELISADANAAWYAAWMMAWAAYIIPIQVGMTSFVEVAREPSSFARVVAHGLRTSLLIGAAAALMLIALAGPLLSLLGESYAEDAAMPLRILALGVFPMAFTYAYYAVCRGFRGPQKALGFGWTGVVVSLGAAVIAGTSGSLTAIAASWVLVQAVFGAWAAFRLERLKRELTAEGTNAADGLLREDERPLCVTRAEFGERRGQLAVLGRGHSASEPGVLALTDRRMLFVGDDGGRLAVPAGDLRAWRVDRRPDGARDLWARTVVGTAVIHRVSPEVRDALDKAGWAAAAPRRRWTELLPVAGAAGAGAVWAAALAGVRPEEVGALGLVSALPPAAFVALALLCLSFALSVSRAAFRTPVLAVHVLVLVLMLHGATSLIEQVPSFNVTWRHAGIAAYIADHGATDPSINAYFNWPGFFALIAFAGKLAGVHDALALSRWAPLVFNLLYLPPLLLIVRTATNDRRLPWVAAWIFYLANWVHQDYLSPQGLVLLLYLGFVAIVLRWLGKDPRAEPRAAQRAALVGVCFLLLLAAIPSHQLTPFAMLAAALALLVVRASSIRTLPAIAAVLAVAWLVFAAGPYLSGHFGELKGDVGQVGATVSSNVSSRVKGSSEHTLVAYTRILFAAFVWALAAAATLLSLRSRQRRWLPIAALAVAPFGLLLLQAYGGEIVLRIYLFGLPFVAALAAALLLRAPPGPRLAAAVTCASVLMAGLFLLARYGNEQVNLFTPGEVGLVEKVERQAPPGSVLVAPTGNLPWESERVGDLRFRTLTTKLDAGDRPRLARAVATTMQDKDASTGYLVITRNTREYERMFGAAPWGTIDELERAVQASHRFLRVRSNREGDVYELLPGDWGQLK